MIKLIGDKSVFAIEYDLIEVEDKYYYGYIWFWIEGKRIGANYDATHVVPYLSSSVSYMKEFVGLKENRRFLGSEEIPAQYMFFILYERFYKSLSSNQKDYEDAGNFREIFSLESVGQESFFDTVQMVMIDEPSAKRQRFLWKLYDDDKLEEFFIPHGHFEEVAFSYINQIENDVADWIA